MGRRTEAILYTILLSFLLCSNNASAKISEENCWVRAGEVFEIDPVLLYSIAQNESSLRPKVVGEPNRNGTRDIGIMQINTSHLKVLKEKGITKNDLLNPCINIFVGAWILRGSKNSMGTFWDGIGAYNVGLKRGKKYDRLRKKYAERIRPIYERNLRLFNTKAH